MVVSTVLYVKKMVGYKHLLVYVTILSSKWLENYSNCWKEKLPSKIYSAIAKVGSQSLCVWLNMCCLLAYKKHRQFTSSNKDELARNEKKNLYRYLYTYFYKLYYQLVKLYGCGCWFGYTDFYFHWIIQFD